MAARLVPEKGKVMEKLRNWGSGWEEKLLFTSKGGGAGQPTGSQREGAGRGHCLIWVGKAREGFTCLKCGHPTLGVESYQDGKWGTQKLSPPTSKKEEEACNIQRRAKHSLLWHRVGKDRGPGPRPSPALHESRCQVSRVSGALFHHLGKDGLSIGTRLQAPDFFLPKNPTLAESRCSHHPS